MSNPSLNSGYTFQNMSKNKNVNRRSAPNARAPQSTSQNQPRIEKLTVHHSYSQNGSYKSITHTERVPSLNRQSPTPSRQTSNRTKPKPRAKAPRVRSETREFMLGFTVGLIVFGIAALVICNMIFEMLV